MAIGPEFWCVQGTTGPTPRALRPPCPPWDTDWAGLAVKFALLARWGEFCRTRPTSVCLSSLKLLIVTLREGRSG